MDHTERAEYKAGLEWARRNENRLVESYSSDDIIGGSLRTKLFEQAAQVYPTKPGDMESDLAQTLWVLGAFRHVARWNDDVVLREAGHIGVDRLAEQSAGLEVRAVACGDQGDVAHGATSSRSRAESTVSISQPWLRAC